MEAARFQERFCSIRRILFVEPFDAIWVILGASWGPVGCQGSPKIRFWASVGIQLDAKGA